MAEWKSTSRGWSRGAAVRSARVDWPARLLSTVDAALAGVIFVAPLVLGGRHEVGRLVFAVLVGIAGVAWFARQVMLRHSSRWPWPVGAILTGGAAMLVLQLAPLPASWVAWLAPRTAEVLPLWSGGVAPGTLGAWRTISLDPEATRLALAMFAAYGLLFVTVYQRVQCREDVARLVRRIGLSAGLMAAIGFVQFALPNGKFLWIYEHPTHDAGERLGGAFANRNHFAHFVTLGVPGLAVWVLLALKNQSLRLPPPRGEGAPSTGDPKSPERRWYPSRSDRGGGKKRAPGESPSPPAPLPRGEGSKELLVVGGLLVIACAAVMLSCSRGGMLALATAGGAICACLWWAKLLQGRQLALIAAAGVLAFLAIAFTGYEQVMNRLGTLAAESLDDVDAGGGRRRIWEANVAAIRAGGWLGAGAGTHAEVYPLYAADPPGKHYTHAESGYLQIVTENGVPGAMLLAAALAVAAIAGWRALRGAQSTDDFVYAGACAAGLAASAVHSACDFVWYIPACVGTTLILGACLLRMGELSQSAQESLSGKPMGSRVNRPRMGLPWVVGASLGVMFAVLQLLPPALAAGSWDTYLRMADAHREFETKLLVVAPADAQAAAAGIQSAEIAALDAMVAELELVTMRRPEFARGHVMLANRLVQLFNVRQSLSENRLPLSQVRDAAVQSQFGTAAELREWLARALEGNHEILYRAWAHARQAATLAPLEGDAWLRLGELCFLEGRGFGETDAYLQQATIVRPFDGRLLFEVGRQWGGRGLDEWVVALWARAARLPGPHRLHIARSVAGRMPVAAIVEAFAPEWDALPEYWRAVGNPEADQPPEEIAALLTYASEQAERESATARPEKAAFMWRTLGQMQRDAAQTDAAIASFARACAALPEDYASHKLLGLALCEAAQLDNAEAQLAWCRNRRADDPAVEAAVVRIAQARESAARGSVIR